MTFIPEDKKEEESVASEEKSASPPASEKKEKKAEKKSGNPINSIIFLVIIGVALYYSRDFLSGEKEIPGLSQALTETSPGEDATPTGELKIPRVTDRALKALLEEFKTEYEARHDSLLLLQTKPEVTRIRYSEDKENLLIVMKSLLPSSGESQTQEIIYGMDDFDRLVTTGEFSEIKLYPEE